MREENRSRIGRNRSKDGLEDRLNKKKQVND